MERGLRIWTSLNLLVGLRHGQKTFVLDTYKGSFSALRGLPFAASRGPASPSRASLVYQLQRQSQASAAIHNRKYHSFHHCTKKALTLLQAKKVNPGRKG